MLLSFNFHDNLAKQIAIYGDYSTMIWFQDNNFTMSQSALIDVAKRGDARLFQKIINDFPGSRQILIREKSLLLFDSFTFAAKNGHLNILEYAISTGLLRNNDEQSFTLMEIASQFCHLEILKWFYPRIKRNNRKILNARIFNLSILGNQMHILEWMLESLEWYNGQLKGDLHRENNFDSETMMVAPWKSNYG